MGKKRNCIVIIAFIVLIFLIVWCYMFPYIKTASLCESIKNGSREETVDMVNKMKDVNRASSPAFLRKVYNVLGYDIELPLVVACKNGDYEMVKLLLEKGADPNKYLEENWSAVEATCLNGNKDRFRILKLLLEYGADVNLHSSDTSALFYELQNLIYKDNIAPDEKMIFEETIMLLLENGAKIIDGKGDTIIHYLAFANEISMLKKIVPEYSTLINSSNIQGETPLIWAVEGEATLSVEYLLSIGAEKDIITDAGKTALDYAKEKNNKAIILFLTN